MHAHNSTQTDMHTHTQAGTHTHSTGTVQGVDELSASSLCPCLPTSLRLLNLVTTGRRGRTCNPVFPWLTGLLDFYNSGLVEVVMSSGIAGRGRRGIKRRHRKIQASPKPEDLELITGRWKVSHKLMQCFCNTFQPYFNFMRIRDWVLGYM